MLSDSNEKDLREYKTKNLWKDLAYNEFMKSRGADVSEEKIEQLKSDFIAWEDTDASRKTEGIDEESLLFLQLRLSLVDLSLAPSPGATKAVLFKHEHVRLIMHFEQNHELPHFHIEYKREFNASYSIPKFERIAGEMPKKYENPILE